MSSKYLLNIISLFLCLSIISSFSIDDSKSFILDNDGRYSVFHGVNVVVKLPPYLPDLDKFDPYFSLNTPYDFQIMKKMGFNMVRLGVIWEAVEKEPGVYDMEYLEKVEEIINNLGKNGIYTMVDAHQDVFSRNFCGEGVPYFYTNQLEYNKKCDASLVTQFLGFVGYCKTLSDFDFNYDENGLPLVEDCKKQSFAEYHYLAEFSSAYKQFYLNTGNVQDKFIEFWKVVATKFKGNKYVLGYDFWNEPAPGGFLEDFRSVIPGRADLYSILPLYRRLEEALREIDPNYILYFENTPMPDTLPIFGGLVWGTMKEKPSDDDTPQVYNFHSYCCVADVNACKNGEASLKDSLSLCTNYHKKKFNTEIDNAKNNLHVPMFVSEFGACSDSQACYNEIMNVVSLCEENFISWSYWNYKPYGDHTTSAIEVVDYEGIYNVDGTIQTIKEQGLSRAYVQYYQGKPIDFKYEEESNTNFETSFEYHANISEPTVLFFNKQFFYSNGYQIDVINDETKESLLSNKGIVLDESNDNYIYIKGDSNLLEDKTKVRIIFKAL